MQALYDVPAPAKINLFLHVLGRRPDGYHLLQTVFRFIDLHDSLGFERTSDGLVGRAGTGPGGLSADDDLAVRAARLLQQATGVTHGVRIHYEKRIPVGAGLGGGSSDAASTLIALNRLWGTGLRRSDLQGLALSLGADVPVFVFGQTAFGEGIGERLHAIELPDQAYTLFNPGIQVSTATVFADPDLTRNTESVKIPFFADWQTGHSGLFGRNDLQAIVYRRYPPVARLATAIGGPGSEVRMTGAGSCLFLQFADVATARVQHDQIISKIQGLPKVMLHGSWVCRGLPEHPLRGWLND